MDIHYDAVGSRILDLLFGIHFSLHTKLYLEAYEESGFPVTQEQQLMIASLQKKIGVPSIPIGLFFSRTHNRACPIVAYFIDSHQSFASVEEFIEHFCLLTHRNLQRILLTYYCDKTTTSAQMIENALDDVNARYALIRQSNISAKHQWELICFFEDTGLCMTRLKMDLIKLLPLISTFHHSFESDITDFRSHFTQCLNHPEKLNEFFNEQQINELNDLAPERCTVYYSLLHTRILCPRVLQDEWLLFVGVKRKEYLKLLHDASEMDVKAVSKALGDGIRFQMLKLLKTEPLCLSDLKQALSLSGSTCYMHVDVLLSAGLISAKSKGRTTYYSLCTDQLQRYCRVIAHEWRQS